MSIDPKAPIRLTSVRTDVEAAAIVAALAACDIEASTTGGYTAGFRAEAPGYVHVVVRQEDLARAQAELDRLKADPGIDWSQVDVGQPDEK